MTRPIAEKMCWLVLAAAMVWMTACGSGSRSAPSGNFAATSALSSAGAAGVAGVTLSRSNVGSGESTQMMVRLTSPAPAGGLAVQLKSSDNRLVSVPATVTVQEGQTTATAAITTAAVNRSATVSVSAQSGQTMAASALSVVAATTASFSVSVPSPITVADGQSRSVKLTTKVVTGYNHSLQLSASNVPIGVTVRFNPSLVPAPGAGTSKVSITVASTVAIGTYYIHLKATDGTTSSGATLTLKVAVNPGAKFQACWYHSNGHRYQGVLVSVTDPGSYPLDAELYDGTTCSASSWADEIGFGTNVNFGTFSWTFYFSDFADQSNMSTRWHVGPDTSACLAYTATTPSCP